MSFLLRATVIVEIVSCGTLSLASTPQPTVVDLSTVGTVTPGAIFQGRERFSQAGNVAGVGDVNGDGRDDFIIGAPLGGGTSSPTSHQGESFLIYGPTSSTFNGSYTLNDVGSSIPGVAWLGTDQQDFAGVVAPAGDVNHDGRSDILINGIVSGRQLYYMAYGQPAPTPLAGTINVPSIGSSVSGARFRGESLANTITGSMTSAGDFNGDGINDLVVTDPRANVSVAGNSRVRAGKTYVIYGQAAALPFTGQIDLAQIGTTVPGAVFVGTVANDNTGESVSYAGDVNGDGVDDLLIGGPNLNKAFLVYGRNSNPYTGNNIDLLAVGSAYTGAIIRFPSSGDFGTVAAAGDVDRDGFDDFLIGAGSATVGTDTRAGQAFLVFGSPTSSGKLLGELSTNSIGGTIRGAMFYGNDNEWQTGSALAGVGDANSDGYDDFLIGSPNADINGLDAAGQVHLVFGGPSGALLGNYEVASIGPGIPGIRFDGFADGALTGTSIAAAGDINGDGVPDFLIGARRAPSDQYGQAYLIYGTIPEPASLIQIAVLAALISASRRRERKSP